MTLYASNLMNTNVVTARPDDTIAVVARRLMEHRISAVPVCDAEGHLLGMLSEGDLMRPFTSADAQRRISWLRMLAEGHDLAPQFIEYLRQDHRRARDLMTKDVITVTEGARAIEIAGLLMQHHIKRVPVLRDGKVVGIVSRADLIRAIAQMADALDEPT